MLCSTEKSSEFPSDHKGHEMTILNQQSNLMLRGYYLSQHVIDDWNFLPSEAFKAKTILQFKKKLGGHATKLRKLSAP